MSQKYSLIVVGAGISGLSTCLAWNEVYPAKDNPVLLLEKNPTVGGCVTTFARQGFRFDTTQIIPDIFDVMDFFGLDIPLLKFDKYYARLFLADVENRKTKIIPVPSSFDDFEASLTERYPDDARELQSFFGYCRDMHSELNYLKTEPRWYDIPGILLNCPKILAQSGKTYAQFLKRFKFKNSELEQVLDIFSSFSGLSGDRCAALLTACAMVTTLYGSYRPVKGFLTFPVSMLKKAEAAGVEFRPGTKVERILSREGKVIGVRLVSGEELLSDYVVCTADTKHTFEEMLGDDVLKPAGKRFYRKVKEAKMSPSGFAIQLGLDDRIDLAGLGFNCGYNVLTSSYDAHSKMFDAWESGEQLISDHCFHLAVIAPYLMTGGKPNLIIHVVPAALAQWAELRESDYELYTKEKEKIAEFFIQKTEAYMIPELSKHIVYMDVSSPATYQRWIGSPTASQYDMLPFPSNFGKNRLPTRTPIEGLFVPKFSHGIWPCMQAGLQVVDMISRGKIMQGKSSLKRGNKI